MTSLCQIPSSPYVICLMMTWTHPDMTLCRHQIPLPVVHTLLDSELGEGKENSAPQFLWCRCFGTRVKGNSVRQTHPVYASSLQSLNNRMPVYETYVKTHKLDGWIPELSQPAIQQQNIYSLCEVQGRNPGPKNVLKLGLSTDRYILQLNCSKTAQAMSFRANEEEVTCFKYSPQSYIE